MDLASVSAGKRFNDFVMRLCAVLVSLSLMVSLVIQPPKAKAVIAEGALITIAAAFLASCGLSWAVSGIDSSGFETAVGGLLQDYLDTEFAGQTPLEWAGAATVIATPAGRIQIPAILARKVAAFANWVVDKYGITAGGSAVTVFGGTYSLRLADGTSFSLQHDYNYNLNMAGPGALDKGKDLYLSNGAKFTWSGDSLRFYAVGDTTYRYSYAFGPDNDTQIISGLLYVMAEQAGTWAVVNRIYSKGS